MVSYSDMAILRFYETDHNNGRAGLIGKSRYTAVPSLRDYVEALRRHVIRFDIERCQPW